LTKENEDQKTETPLSKSALKDLLFAEFSKKTTDELLELLPSYLHLAQNENAPDRDRWRIYNAYKKKYVEPGKATARELMIYTAARLEEQHREWTSK